MGTPVQVGEMVPKAVVAKELARMLVIDGQPFATVMRPGFRGFLEAVGRPLVHRSTVESAYKRMYAAEVEGKITSHVAIGLPSLRSLSPL